MASRIPVHGGAAWLALSLSPSCTPVQGGCGEPIDGTPWRICFSEQTGYECEDDGAGPVGSYELWACGEVGCPTLRFTDYVDAEGVVQFLPAGGREAAECILEHLESGEVGSVQIDVEWGGGCCGATMQTTIHTRGDGTAVMDRFNTSGDDGCQNRSVSKSVVVELKDPGVGCNREGTDEDLVSCFFVIHESPVRYLDDSIRLVGDPTDDAPSCVAG